MATIINPNPVTAGTFGGMWIRNLQVILPGDGKPGMLQANLLPYDGQHLLATGEKRVFVTNLAARRSTDAPLDAMLTALVTEVKRQAKTESEPKMVNVMAMEPSKPVVAMVMFAEGKPYRVDDCFALADTDHQFGQVFNQVMGEVARQAGLTVQ
jgi:hypothetical protein